MTKITSKNGAELRKLNMVESSAQMSEVYNAISAELGITADEVQALLMKTHTEKILAQHKESWPWWQNKKGRWVTYIPDSTKKDGRRQISANDEPALIEKVVAFYDKHPDTDSTLTLRILYPEWISWKAKNGVSKKGRIKPQTIRKNKNDWLRYYEHEPIVDRPLKAIAADELQLWVFDMIDKYQMDRHQFGNFHSIIAQMFEYAVKEHNISSNPFKELDNLWVETREKDSKPDEVMAFPRNEMQKMIDYCWEQYRMNRYLVQKFTPLAIVFSFYTGLRLGELSALKFSDIHSDGLHIQRAVNDDHVVASPKSNKTRTVPLVSEATELIEEVKRKRIEMGLSTDSYIFSIDDEPFRVYMPISRAVGQYCTELGMPKRSHHAIRRTFISICLANGLSIKEVMDYVGHEHFSTTEKSYLINLYKPDEKVSRLELALAG